MEKDFIIKYRHQQGKTEKNSSKQLLKYKPSWSKCYMETLYKIIVKQFFKKAKFQPF